MSAESRVPILLYHGIVDGHATGFDVSLDDFRRHLDAVATCGRQSETISHLARSLSVAGVGPAPLAVTFDDGTADFWEAAWPALVEYGVRATLYVTTSAVGGGLDGRPMVRSRQLEEVRDAGVEIGSHGEHHVALDVVGERRAALELVNSKLVLEDRLQAPVASFAYPFGYHTRAVTRLVERVGYTSACAVKNALSHPDDDRFALARRTVTAETTLARVTELLAGRGAPLSWPGERTGTRLWRSYRRAREATPV